MTEEPIEDRRRMIASLREIVDRVADASRDLAIKGLRSTPSALHEGLADYLDLLGTLSDMLTGPLSELLEEQARLAEQMAVWSERNAELGEQLASWAERHRRATEGMQSLVRPAVQQVQRVSGSTRELAEEIRR